MISRHRPEFVIISEWFYENCVILNAGRCHFLNVGFNEPFPDFLFKDTTNENVTEEKILAIVIDNKLSFKSHLKNVYKKASKKLGQKMVNPFTCSQFSGCPLIWMFTLKCYNKRIDRIH